ncbi:MAG: hypothetical protein ACE5FC_00465 [Myxococcota bacterium]
MKRKTTRKKTTRSRPKSKARATKKPARKSAKKPARKSAKKPAGRSRAARKPAGKKKAGSAAKPRKRTGAAAKTKRPARAGKSAKSARPGTGGKPRPPLIRKGLPVTKAALRRLGRMQQEDRPEIKSIIVYTTDQKPKNLYPRKIISPPFPSKCCTNKNRVRVGKIYEELGRNYYYKVCKSCGHAVKYYFNKETEFDTPRLRKYYEWKKSVFH